MNPSDWIKPATLVTQHKQEAAMAETDQLSSIPLSQIAMDDSSPPIVRYGTHMPIAVSTPTGTDAHMHSSQLEDSYQQIIPGIPQGSLYPTLSSLSLGEGVSNNEVQSLCDKVSKGLDKYLQDAEQSCALEVNYFDDTTSPTSIDSMSQAAEQINESSETNLSLAKQEAMEEVESVGNILESQKIDTSCILRCPSQPRTDTDKKRQQSPSSEHAEQDTDAHQEDEEHPFLNAVREPISIHSDRLLTVLLPTDDVIMPTEKVDCILVTSHLQQFLEDYPPSSDKQAFLDVYLYDNLKQHTHCMSSDNEYVILLKYAIRLNIDLSTFPTLWAVLSILLDTQGGKCEYIKLLQEEYNTYYTDKSRKYMLKLEKKSVEIQICMHDSVTQNFDRVTDSNDNGSTSLQGQQDEQPEGIYIPGDAIDDDVIDIMTLYPPWSPDTKDSYDMKQIANVRSRKEIQDKLYKDTPVKTKINKPFIDSIDAYNRDRALITKFFSDRLGLGQYSLPGAQQVRVAVKHTDQSREFPEHLRQISLGEEIENINYEEIGKNRNFIPQVDGIIDNRDSLDQTPDSIDLTESPVKHTHTQRHIEKINEDTSDNDTDKMITFDEEKVKKTYRKDTNAQRKRAKSIKTKKGRTIKMYTINIERRRLLKQRREKALQNTKDKTLAKENFLTAIQAGCKADKASNDTQSSAHSNNELINGTNEDTITQADNIDNIEIVAENATNTTTNADNIDNAEVENVKSEDIALSYDNIDNTAMSDNNTHDTILGDGNAENVTPGEISTDDVPSPLLYNRKTTDPSRVKTSRKHRPIQVKPLESSMDDPTTDEITTKTVKGHTFDPTDVQVYEFFIQGTPNPKDLEGVKEDQLLDIQRIIQEKLREREEERERNITNRMKQYE